jgi:hypothetical protein
MGFDMTRCPQVEIPEAQDWFYAGIGKMMGQSASGWEAVMEACGLPPGYGPGIVPTALMPYFAFTQQYSGGPKGRIFLPTSIPDELGYYTRCLQYLDDAAGTRRALVRKGNSKKVLSEDLRTVKSGLVWSWYWVAGHEYDPVQTETGGGTTPIPPSGGLTEAQVQAMIDDSIQQAVAGFEGIVFGSKIALRTNSGLLSGIKGGGPTQNDAPIEWIGKTGPAHAWESFIIEKGE